jgi:desulfoferrodoxin (superoxide reductase-like protein)
MTRPELPPLARRRWLVAAAGGAAASLSLPAAAGLADPPSIAVPEWLKFPKDPQKLAPGQESSHTPYVTLERAERASVAYGKTPEGNYYKVTVQARHESIADHYINRISLYVNGTLLAAQDMNQALIEAALPVTQCVLRLQPGDELLAITDCNKHGQWARRVVV